MATRRSAGLVVEGDVDPDVVRPGTFELEWPPRSGRRSTFPEVDQVGWFDLGAASARIVTGQRELLDRRRDAVAAGEEPD